MDHSVEGLSIPAVEQATRVGRAPSELFLNRELGWLAFNHRVLHEAVDERTPLLDRLTFLGIFTSNLDEFFMKRVGGLKRQVATGILSRSLDGRTAEEQLTEIRQAVAPMLVEQADCFQHLIKPRLQQANISLLEWPELEPVEREEAAAFFHSTVYPVLTPLAVDPAHPFPFISNLSQSLGVVLKHPGSDEHIFARIKLPPSLPRWVRLQSHAAANEYRFARLQSIIEHHLDHLFRSMQILAVMPFRITRNADIERDEEDADDLLAMIEEELRERRFARAVRLEHGPNPNPWILDILIKKLKLAPQDVYEMPGELDYTDLRPLAELPLPEHKAPPWAPVLPAVLADPGTDMFHLIRSGDLLFHHPYESFSGSVERFIKAAAADPMVLAIKMTIYRTGDESPFISTLIKAAQSGKQVVCLVEVTARFDEQRNILVAQQLEKAGIHVVYGVMGLKTHCKTVLIVRREPEGVRCYAHIGTGNYHTGTARLYTDIGLLTANPAFTADVVELFHHLTGLSNHRQYEKLLVAPLGMKQRFLEMIEREVKHQREGRVARIVAKMNALEDDDIIQALYRASEAGVQIDLIVRGFCCLRAGVKGLSENIRVISIVGRFLEHSRIFYFRNDAPTPAEGEFYIGSADWMHRNLHHRVEAVVPIETPSHREQLWQVFQIMLNDRRQAWEMRPDGCYEQLRPTNPAEEIPSHATLMQWARQQQAAARQ